MRNTLFASLATLPLFAAAPAFAQSVDGGPPSAAPVVAPAVVVVAPAARPALPRWTVGLHFGGVGLHPEDDADAHTDFGGGGLTIGYRLAQRWVLAATIEGGTEQLENGEEGDRHLSLFTIEAQFHPRPYAKWDWYVAAGVGGGAISTGEGDDAVVETEGGVFTLGAGIERHIGRWGIGAELRMIGMAVEEPDDSTARMTVPDEDEEQEHLSGGALSIFGAYHF
jgi:hypothetical protein